MSRVDESDYLFEKRTLFLFADVVLEVGTVEGLLQEDAVGNAEPVNYVPNDGLVGGGS